MDAVSHDRSHSCENVETDVDRQASGRGKLHQRLCRDRHKAVGPPLARVTLLCFRSDHPLGASKQIAQP